MESQKEIGQVIRERMGDTQKTLDAPVWDRIQETLVRKKKRRSLFSWSLNALILMITIGGFTVLSKDLSSNTETSLDTNNNVKESNKISSTNESSILKTNSVIKSDNKLENKQISLTKTKKEELAKTTTVSKIQESSSKKANPKKVVSTHDPYTTENNDEQYQESSAVRTEKVYYYYNSKDGQEVTSKDKKVIDSTMQANSLKKDSVQ